MHVWTSGTPVSSLSSLFCYCPCCLHLHLSPSCCYYYTIHTNMLFFRTLALSQISSHNTPCYFLTLLYIMQLHSDCLLCYATVQLGPLLYKTRENLLYSSLLIELSFDPLLSPLTLSLPPHFPSDW